MMDAAQFQQLRDLIWFLGHNGADVKCISLYGKLAFQLYGHGVNMGGFSHIPMFGIPVYVNGDIGTYISVLFWRGASVYVLSASGELDWFNRIYAISVNGVPTPYTLEDIFK